MKRSITSSSLLNKLVESESSGDFYDDIVETCVSYDDYGKLLTELMMYFSGSGGWDDKVVDLLEEMYSEYYCDVVL